MSDSSPQPQESSVEEKVVGQTGDKDHDDEDPLVIDEAEDKPPETVETEDGNPEEDNEKEFEPTVDMLMNEFDDEQTIEEEEALGQEDDGIIIMMIITFIKHAIGVEYFSQISFIYIRMIPFSESYKAISYSYKYLRQVLLNVTLISDHCAK